MAKTPTNIKTLARAHTASAIRILAGIMRQSKAPAAARVAAAVALLNRGWGMPTQPLSGDEDGGPVIIQIVKLSDADLGIQQTDIPPAS